MRGLLVEVLRCADGHDCTAGGISSKHEMLVLTGDGVPQIFDPSEDCPEVRLVVEDICFGEGRGGLRRVCARPVGKNGQPEEGWWMFGGNFVFASDSRFPNFSAEGVMALPIPIHDRKEG